MGTSYHRTVAKYESERENVSNMKKFEEKIYTKRLEPSRW